MKNLNLNRMLDDIKSAKVGIVGDFCLDVYWDINELKSETSVETNLKTRPVESQKYSLGGAGNVANNLHTMGVLDIKVFGTVGNDPFGDKMKSLITDIGINSENLIVQEKCWSSHVYIKPICNGEEESRIDFGNYNNLSDKTSGRLLKRLEVEIDSLDILIINQQVINGIHNSKTFRVGLQKIINKAGNVLFILDSRHLGGDYKGVMHKINSYEATKLCGLDYRPDDFISLNETRDAMTTLYKKWQQPIFVTRGARGCLIIDDNGIYEIPGLLLTGKLDTVGAGDSMLAGIVACLAKGYSPLDSATFGNFVAGVTVQKLYITGTASPEEIVEIGESSDYVYNVDKADDIRSAKYFSDSEIELISELPNNLNITHIIFDHDGTISTLREGWENIMQPMMMNAILGNHFNSVNETMYYRVEERVKKFIDETTGIQTLKQMQGLVALVKEFGFVSNSNILDELGYKQIYNTSLLKVVRERIKKLDKYELSVDDFVIKGAVDFLNYVHSKGIKLYLASGTDQEDVIKEAGGLGYSDLFEGRIFGSVGDVDKDAKKIVMNRIIENIGMENGQKVLAIGDGPVEIREIKKCGGIAIGLASDEIRRFGLNLSKRSRLIKAGSDLIIPDFSQREILYRLLNI